MTQKAKVHPYLSYNSVTVWFREVGHDRAPASQQTSLLRLLQGFCDTQNKSPDELVSSCLRTTSAGDLTISAKARREIDAAIDQFIADSQLTGHQAVAQGNKIREFLIHNGVFMQGKVSMSTTS